MKRTTWLENLLRVSVFENELLKIEKEELIKELNRLRPMIQDAPYEGDNVTRAQLREVLKKRILCKP